MIKRYACVALLLGACNAPTERTESAQPAPAAAPVAESDSEAPSHERYGASLSAGEVLSLDQVLGSVDSYDGKVIKVGDLAGYVLDHRIPLELCLSSNVHTGATASMEEHPFPIFMEKMFRVTLNTDNRLMSRTTMTDEYTIAVERFGCSMSDLELLAINGMKSAFVHYDQRVHFIYERIKAGYAALKREFESQSQ